MITEFDTTDEFGDVVTPKHSSTKQDVFGWIGEDTSDNDSYLGLAMYKVETTTTRPSSCSLATSSIRKVLPSPLRPALS